jgi:endonuclease III
MKNSKEYSQEIRKLYRSLKRKHKKVQPDIYDDPVDGLIYAIISEQMSQAATQSVIKKFADYFIDQNDLRVSRAEEVVAALGEDTPLTRDIALALTKALRTVFDKYHTVSLKALKKMGKKPARQVLEKINGVTPFVVDYCVLASLQGHAIPLTRKMIDYLRHNELVHPDADDQQIEGFLAKQISADNAYEFYALLRRESESRRARRKKAARTTGMKAATKTKRKTRKTKLRKK